MFATILIGLVFLSDPPATYEGLTLDEWRERMKSLELDNPESRSAVPGMMAIVQDETLPWFTRRQAALTLGRLGSIGKDAVPMLAKLLKEPSDDDESTRIWIGKALALFGPEAATVTPTAIEILQDDRSRLGEKQVMIELLGRIGARHPQAIPALIQTLQTTPPTEKNAARDVNTLRALAGESLATAGSDAVAAIPALTRTLYDENELVRRRAVEALGAIGPSAAVAMSSLLETLIFDESAAVRDSAEVSLSQLGPSAVEPVTRLLSDAEPAVRERAAGILARIGNPAKSSADELTERLRDDAAGVRMRAAEALWAIKRDAATQRLIPFLIDALAQDDRQLRIRAFRLLIEIGTANRRAVTSALEASQDDPRTPVRQAVQKALRNLANQN